VKLVFAGLEWHADRRKQDDRSLLMSRQVRATGARAVSGVRLRHRPPGDRVAPCVNRIACGGRIAVDADRREPSVAPVGGALKSRSALLATSNVFIRTGCAKGPFAPTRV
jgi:hypothetical protein